MIRVVTNTEPRLTRLNVRDKRKSVKSKRRIRRKSVIRLSQKRNQKSLVTRLQTTTWKWTSVMPIKAKRLVKSASEDSEKGLMTRTRVWTLRRTKKCTIKRLRLKNKSESTH